MEKFFLDLFGANPHVFGAYGVSLLFALSFFESLPVVGALLPGQTIVIFGGFLIKIKVLAFWPSFLAASLGAITGDIIGFVLGKKYGTRILKREKFLIDTKHLRKTTEILEGNSIKSIFFGRLHSFTRTLMPFAAGMSKIETKKFLSIDIITALIWAALSLGLGFVFGKSFELIAGFIGKFAIMTSVIIAIIILAIYLVKKSGKKISIADATIFGSLLLSSYLFYITASSFETSKILHIIDKRAVMLSGAIRSDSLTYIMEIFTTIGGPAFVCTGSVILLIYLGIKNRWRNFAYFIFSVLFGWILADFLKACFERTRPFPSLIVETGSSFPSGHAMLATIISITLYQISFKNIKKESTKSIVMSIVGLTAFCIALSRIYLGVHWASDILGGIFAGVAFASFSILLFKLISFIIERYKHKKSLPEIL